jgi:hypothetical protein
MKDLDLVPAVGPYFSGFFGGVYGFLVPVGQASRVSRGPCMCLSEFRCAHAGLDPTYS